MLVWRVIGILLAIVAAIILVDDFVKRYFINEDSKSEFHYDDQVVKYSNNSGLAMNNAIIIEGARTSDVGIKAQSHYLNEVYPHYKIDSRHLELSDDGSRQYDVWELGTKYDNKTLYFDITGWYGTPSSDPEKDYYIQKILYKSKKFIDAGQSATFIVYLPNKSKVTVAVNFNDLSDPKGSMAVYYDEGAREYFRGK